MQILLTVPPIVRWDAVKVEVILKINTWCVPNGHLVKYLHVSDCYGNLSMSLCNKIIVVRKPDRAGP